MSLINTIKMYEILKATERKMTKYEIAKRIGEDIGMEVNPRNIPEYQKKLNEIYPEAILSTNGKGGGYFIGDSFRLPFSLTAENTESLRDLYNFICHENIFNKKIYLSILSKILGNANVDIDFVEYNDNSTPKFIGNTGFEQFKEYPLTRPLEEIQDVYKSVRSALMTKTKLKLRYESVAKSYETTIHPYKLYKYEDWYLICYDEVKREFQRFKLYRMFDIKPLMDKFEKDSYYTESEFIDKHGNRDDNKVYNLELIVPKHVSRLLSERVYGNNQSIKKINSKTYIFNVSMRGTLFVKKFLFSLGKEYQMIGPKDLKDEMQRDIETMLHNYKINKEIMDS